MTRLHRTGVLVAIAVFAAGCPKPPPATPDPSRSEIAVDRPTGAIANGSDRVSISVTVRDSAGAPVPGVQVVLAATGTGNTLLQPSGPTDASGVATGTLASTVAETKTISATIPQGAIPFQPTAAFGAGPASSATSTVVAAPLSVAADGISSATITVTLRDAHGNAVSNKAVTLSATGSQNTFTQPAPTDVSGVTVGVIRSTRAETKVVTATVDGVALLQEPTLQFTAGTAARLGFLVPPGAVTAGATLSPPVQVEIQDAGGNRVSGATHAVTLTLSGGTAGAVLGGTRTAVATDGVAVFVDLSVDKAGTGYALIASGTGLSLATSPAFNVTPGPSSKLAFVVGPSDTVAGAPISPAIQVALQDASGNLVTTGSTNVTLALIGPGGTLSGASTVASSSGIASFPDLSINRAGNGYTLVATASGYTGASSGRFNITVGPASRLAFTAQPSAATSGAAISPAIQVTVQDAAGNTIAGDTRAVALTIGNNPGGATLSGTTTVNANNGVATFAAVSLDKAGNGYTLVASAAALNSAVSAQFNVAAGAPSRLAFISQPPASVASGEVLAPAVQVAVQDAAGNTISTANNSVTLSLSGGTAGAVLSGGLTQSAVGGIATFGALSVDRAGTGYALSASGAALVGATSSAFAVVSGPATRLVFSTQPSDAVAGQALAPAVRVSVVDAAGNTVTSANPAITVALGGGTGATLSGTLTVNATNGVASFGNLSVDRAGSGYVLTASAASLTGIGSSTFSISPGAPNRLTFTTQPVSSTAGALMSVAVTVLDAFGNVVPSPALTVTLALASGPATSLGGTTSASAATGEARFGDLHVDRAGTGYSLAATATGVSSATSNAFNISPAAPSQLVFVQQPSTVDTDVAIAPPVTVAIQDRFGNATASTATVSMALASNPSGGVLSGTTSVAAVAGTATFADLRINRAAAYTLVASTSGLPSSTSATFTVNQGAVAGTRIIRYVVDTEVEPVNRPSDLSASVIGAYAQVGAAIAYFPGTGTDAGTFQIPGVPAGSSFYLRFGNDYIATSARTIDLGHYQQGRPDVTRADAGTYQHTSLSNMAPWTFDAWYFRDDTLQMYSSNADVWFSDLENMAADGGQPSPGDTVFDQVTDYDQLRFNGFTTNLVNATRGDRTYITQLTVRDAGFITDDAGTVLEWNTYNALERVYGPNPVTVADGQLSSVTGAFTAVPQQSLSLSWLIDEGTPGSFNSFRTAVHPNARTDFISHSFFVSALPRSGYGFYGAAPDLLVLGLNDGTFTPQPNQSLVLRYGDPFPGSWARFGDGISSYFARYFVPRSGTDAGTTVSTNETASLAVVDLLPSFPTPLRPQISPPTNPTIDGASFFSNQTLATTTPVISWGPPAMGTPTYYTVRIRRASAGPTGGVSKVDVARIHTTARSVTVPPGILQPGSYYLMRITATYQPGRSIETAPYIGQWPMHSAAALSGLFTVP